MSKIISNYMPWIRERVTQVNKSASPIANLAYSNIYEPTHLLIKTLNSTDFTKTLEKPYEWHHTNLTETLAHRYQCKPTQVITTQSATSAFFIACKTYIQPGDHVLIENPVYQPLIEAPQYCKAKIDFIPRLNDSNFNFNLTQVKKTITSKTKLIILTNPHNPSGALLNSEELISLASTAQSVNKDIKIIVDEIYHDFVRNKHPSSTTLNDCFITVNSLSKVYGLGTAQRCGWIIAAQKNITELKRAQILIENCNSRLNEALTNTILNNPQEWDTQWRQILAENLNYMTPIINNLTSKGVITGSFPPHSCTYFPRLAQIADTGALTENWFNKHQLWVIPGHFFQAPEHIRIGFGDKPESFKPAIKKLESLLLSNN